MRNSTCYKLAGAKTFRLSSSKILGRYGGNLQNIEKSMREIYIPDDGRKFCQVDQSGAEALIVAYLCEPADFRQLFINGVKPHVYVALRLFKDIWAKKMREARLTTADSNFDIDDIIATPIPLLKKNPFWKDLDLLIKDSDNWSLDERYYYLAKQTCHSGNYGITPPTFRMNILEKSGGKIVISKDDSERFIMTYNALFPELQEWHKRVRSQIQQCRMLFNLHGHPYTVTQYDINESHWKEYYAWIPQSTVGEITNIAYAGFQRYIEEEGKHWDLLANTHDSYLIQFPPDEEDEVVRKAKEFMEQRFVSPVDGAQFQMRSEAATGYNWRPYKEGKNELGLKEYRT